MYLEGKRIQWWKREMSASRRQKQPHQNLKICVYKYSYSKLVEVNRRGSVNVLICKRKTWRITQIITKSWFVGKHGGLSYFVHQNAALTFFLSWVLVKKGGGDVKIKEIDEKCTSLVDIPHHDWTEEFPSPVAMLARTFYGVPALPWDKGPPFASQHSDLYRKEI